MAYQNFYATKLQNPIGASDTTITVQTAPTAASGRLVLDPRNTQTREIISYTGVSGTDLTGVTRGLYGTTAQPHLAGVLTEMNFLAEDYQDLVDAFNSFSGLNASGWNTMVDLPNTVAANGQRSYTLTYTGVDVTNLLSPGTRLRTTRTVAAPTRCTDLEASSSQYWVKTSPNKLTFTDDFVVSAWVKLSSYGSDSVIASRMNGTSGWFFRVNTTGQVELYGFNASASNYSRVASYQSVPLNKWVHVTAQLDMSAFTATTTTSYVMVDGVDVPALVSRAGTNPTALVQAGDLEIGAYNGATNPFDGKIAQVAIYSAKVTQANIRATISQGITGSETSLASAYSFDGVATDLMVTTPNDLTAQASAVATNADSPFGIQASGLVSSTLDYGIVQSVAFSTDSTIVVQVPEGNTIPSSGGVSAVSYSNMKAPYGMPISRNKWEITSYFDSLTLGNVSATLYSGNTAGAGQSVIKVPVGSWNVGYRGTLLGSAASTADTQKQAMLSSDATNDDGFLPESKSYIRISTTQANTFVSMEMSGDQDVSLASQTNIYVLAYTTVSTSNHSWSTNGVGLLIKARNAYV